MLLYLQPLIAHVAELVDAADSKSAIRKDVKVRFLSWAHNHLNGWFFYSHLPYIYQEQSFPYYKEHYTPMN